VFVLQVDLVIRIETVQSVSSPQLLAR